MDSSGAPSSQDEYVERFRANQSLEGFGIDLIAHVPCPFCAARDWLVHAIVDTQDALTQGAVCSECARGAKAVITTMGDRAFLEVVQTAGPAQPDWLTPRLRDLRHSLH